MFEKNNRYNDVLSILNSHQFASLSDDRKKDILTLFDENEDGIINFVHKASVQNISTSISRYKDTTLYFGSLYELVGNADYELPRIHLIVRSGDKYLLNTNYHSFVPGFKKCENMISPLRVFIQIINGHLKKYGIGYESVLAIRDIYGIKGDIFHELFFIVDVEKECMNHGSWMNFDDIYLSFKDEPMVFLKGLEMFKNAYNDYPEMTKEY